MAKLTKKKFMRMTDDQIADYCESKDRNQLLEYLVAQKVEIKKRESTTSLKAKATRVAIALRDSSDFIISKAQEFKSGDGFLGKPKTADAPMVSMGDLIAHARQSAEAKSVVKKERGPRKPHMAYAEIVKVLLDHPNGIGRDELFAECMDSRKDGPEKAAKITFNSRLYELANFCAVFGLGSYTSSRSTGLITLSMTSSQTDHFHEAAAELLSYLTETKKTEEQ